MTDEDQIAAYRASSEPPEYDHPPICAECGLDIGIIQHVDIAWPYAKGRQRHVELWLHPECEVECIKRLEADRKP